MKNLSIPHYAMIHDLLPWSRGRSGKTHAVIHSELRSRGVKITRRQIEHALESMEGLYGLIRTVDARGQFRWKRRNGSSLGQHFYLEDLEGDPLDIDFHAEECDSEYLLHLDAPGAWARY